MKVILMVKLDRRYVASRINIRPAPAISMRLQPNHLASLLYMSRFSWIYWCEQLGNKAYAAVIAAGLAVVRHGRRYHTPDLSPAAQLTVFPASHVGGRGRFCGSPECTEVCRDKGRGALLPVWDWTDRYLITWCRSAPGQAVIRLRTTSLKYCCFRIYATSLR